MAICKIVYSHTIQIHSSNAVIIRFVTTVFASKQMYLFIAVRFFNVSATRAALTCIARVYLNNRRLILFCFVDQFLLKVIERP